MATKIYWFSGSGNSFAVAKAVSEKIEGSELFPIVSAESLVPAAEDTVGFIFPVYSWGPPRLVADFIKKCSFINNPYIFAVYTYGGSAGSTAGITGGLVKKRGGRLSAAYGLHMVENYPPFGGAPGKEKQEKILSPVPSQIERICTSLAERPDGHVDPRKTLWRIMGRIVYPLFMFGLRFAYRSFFADGKCNGCGICAKVCPVANIQLTDGKPAWGSTCEQCYACFHWCPQKAVQHGKRTVTQVRYHHPDVSLKEMTVR